MHTNLWKRMPKGLSAEGAECGAMGNMCMVWVKRGWHGMAVLSYGGWLGYWSYLNVMLCGCGHQTISSCCLP